MSAMTARQQRFLVESYGTGWTTAEMLLSEAGIARAKAGVQGGSLHRAAGRDDVSRGWYSTSGRGIQHDEHTSVGGAVHFTSQVVIPWRAITAHRASLAPALLTRLDEAWGAKRAHQRAYPVMHHPEHIRRVGPSQDLHPEDRQAYAVIREAFYREQTVPWGERERELETELTAAVLACLPLAGDDEPTDLLEMLAAMA